MPDTSEPDCLMTYLLAYKYNKIAKQIIIKPPICLPRPFFLTPRNPPTRITCTHTCSVSSRSRPFPPPHRLTRQTRQTGPSPPHPLPPPRLGFRMTPIYTVSIRLVTSPNLRPLRSLLSGTSTPSIAAAPHGISRWPTIFAGFGNPTKKEGAIFYRTLLK